VSIQKFAERVERLCSRLADGMEHNDDRVAVLKLGEEAADIATGSGKSKLIAEQLSGIAEEIRP